MADILIQGIEMPKAENDVVLLVLKPRLRRAKLFGELKSFEIVDKEHPHGRLIDADALLKKLLTRKDGSRRNDRDSDGWPNLLEVETVRTAIEEAVTIIEASEKEGDSEDG